MKKHYIYELSSKSEGVDEFIQDVKETPGLLKYLGFSSHRDLKDYILDNGIKEFDELRDEVKDYKKENIKENEEKDMNSGLSKLQILFFKAINKTKKDKITSEKFKEEFKFLMNVFNLDPKDFKYLFQLYKLNYRPNGDYENITAANIVDPRFTGEGPRTTNISAFQYTRSKLPFRGSNLKGYWDKDYDGKKYYVVKSYGWYPIYLFKDGYWYKNLSSYSSSTGRQMNNSHPGVMEYQWDRDTNLKVYLASTDELNNLMSNMDHDKFMEKKRQNILSKGIELEKSRLKSVSSGYPISYKVKFRIKKVTTEDESIVVDVDIVDVVNPAKDTIVTIGNHRYTPPNLSKDNAESMVKNKILSILSKDLIREPRYGQPDRDLKFNFNYLSEKK